MALHAGHGGESSLGEFYSAVVLFVEQSLRDLSVAQPLRRDAPEPGSLADPLDLIGVPLRPYRLAVLVDGDQAVIRPCDP